MNNDPSGLLRFFSSRNAFLAMAALGLVIAGAPRSASAQPPSPMFAVFGDMPYGVSVSNYPKRGGQPDDKETDDIVLKYLILPTLKSRGDIPFVIHVGDIGRPEDACKSEALRNTLESWVNLGKPVFYTPGDNDWTDCGRATPPVDPLAQLTKIRNTIFSGSNGWKNHDAPGVGDWRKVPGLEIRSFPDSKTLPTSLRTGCGATSPAKDRKSCSPRCTRLAAITARCRTKKTTGMRKKRTGPPIIWNG